MNHRSKARRRKSPSARQKYAEETCPSSNRIDVCIDTRIHLFVWGREHFLRIYGEISPRYRHDRYELVPPWQHASQIILRLVMFRKILNCLAARWKAWVLCSRVFSPLARDVRRIATEMCFWQAARTLKSTARLAQSAERKALNLVVVGSSPTVGDLWVRVLAHIYVEVTLDLFRVICIALYIPRTSRCWGEPQCVTIASNICDSERN